MTISPTDPPQTSRLRRHWRWLLLASFLWPVLPSLGEEAEVSKEYQVKAAYLYNFVKFVEWPPERFQNAVAPIVVGVLGRNPFAGEFDRLVENRTVQGRVIRLRELRTPEDAASVHLLFVPAGEEARFSAMAPALASAAVLTVGESDGFTAHAGMITFARVGDKVRFSINLAAADRARLKLSAQLLKLATDVRRKS